MEYTSTTAQVIANKGELITAAIYQVGEDYAVKLHQIRSDIRAEYWKQHDIVGKHEFNIGEQTAAIAKLGQLALAVQAVDKAYSAVNSVRCFQ